MRKSVVLFCFLFLLAAPVISVASTVAYDNFGPGDSHEWYGTWFGTLSGGEWPNYRSYTMDVANRFTVSATGALSDLTLGMSYSVGTNAVTLALLSDAGGTVGSALWSRTYTDILGSYNTSITGIGGPELTAGTSYWLMASALDTSSRHSWYAVETAPDYNRMGTREWGTWAYLDQSYS